MPMCCRARSNWAWYWSGMSALMAGTSDRFRGVSKTFGKSVANVEKDCTHKCTHRHTGTHTHTQMYARFQQKQR